VFVEPMSDTCAAASAYRVSGGAALVPLTAQAGTGSGLSYGQLHVDPAHSQLRIYLLCTEAPHGQKEGRLAAEV
jgi:hypothetical protein